MTDLAQLGIEVNTRQVSTANTCLDELADKGKKAKTATDYLKSSFESLNTSRVSNLIESLYDQLDVLEKTTVELLEYKLTINGATDAEIKEALAIQRAIEAREEINKLMEEGKELTRQYMSAEEKLAEHKEHLTKLYNSGTISLGTYNKALADAVDKSKEVEAALKKIADGFESAGRKLSLLSAFIVGIGVASVKTAADIETQKGALEVLLGSTERANALFEKIQKFSAATPFELPELNSATQKLLAFGVAEDAVIQKINQLGNASQGNSQKFESIVNAYGKIYAKGKTSLEELNIMTEAGFPVLKQLEKQYGKTGDALFKFISEGKVGIAGVNTAIEALTTGQGKFAGMLEKQSEKLNGKLSTMIDNLKMAGAALVGSLLPVIKDVVDWVIAAANSFTSLDDNTKRTILTIAGMVAVLGPTLMLISKMITAYSVLAPIILAANAGFTGQALASSASTAATIAHTIATKAATVAQAALNAVMNVNPIVLVVTAIGALAAILAIATLAANRHRSSLETLNKLNKDMSGDLNSLRTAIVNYKSANDDLTTSMSNLNEVEKRSLENKREMARLDMAEGLRKTIKSLAEYKTAQEEAAEENNKFLENIQKSQAEIEKCENLIKSGEGTYLIYDSLLSSKKDKSDKIIEYEKFQKVLLETNRLYDEQINYLATRVALGSTEISQIEQYNKALAVLIAAKAKELNINKIINEYAGKYAQGTVTEIGLMELFTDAQIKLIKTKADAIKKDEEKNKATTEANENVKKMIESLREELLLLGKNKSETLAYKLVKEGATQAQIDEAVAIQKTIEVREKELNLKAEGKQLTEQYRSSEEKYADEEERLADLLATNAISLETYNRALKEAFANTDQGKIEETIRLLKEENESLEKNKYELLANKLAREGATRSQIDEAVALQKKIDLTKEGNQVTEQYMTEKEKLAAAENHLRELYDAGAISLETYNRALLDLQDTGNIVTDTLNKLGRSLLDISLNALVDGLSEVGKGLVAVGDDAKSFTEIIIDMGYQILQQLPSLLLVIGKSLIENNQTGLGIAFIIASGITAIGAGMAKYNKEYKSATKNALGNIYEDSNIIPFSHGSAFTNSIVTEPTFFRFADGTGLMGEAGPEAIVPLTRMPTGELGVKSQGGQANVKIVIVNNSGQPVETKEKQNGDTREIEIIIGKTVNKQLADGTYDNALQRNYNVNRRGIAV